ncbi:hypothetical protein VTN00DRAFT_1433 [Thermoascus crustaceus]|uniref:uncharacterized protein n=1 Tax=Thermoascus crustaceus TaxID=5088 RepID=UPI0037447240
MGTVQLLAGRRARGSLGSSLDHNICRVWLEGLRERRRRLSDPHPVPWSLVSGQSFFPPQICRLSDSSSDPSQAEGPEHHCRRLAEDSSLGGLNHGSASSSSPRFERSIPVDGCFFRPGDLGLDRGDHQGFFARAEAGDPGSSARRCGHGQSPRIRCALVCPSHTCTDPILASWIWMSPDRPAILDPSTSLACDGEPLLFAIMIRCFFYPPAYLTGSPAPMPRACYPLRLSSASLVGLLSMPWLHKVNWDPA